MNKYLNPEEHQQLKSDLLSDRCQLVIPGSVCREFFTRVPNNEIVQVTRRSLMLPKLLVWLGVIAAPLVLIALFGFTIMTAGWLAALMIPLMGIFWTIIAAFMNPDGEWLSITLAILVVGLMLPFMDFTLGYSLFMFIFSLWIHRLTYIFARLFLTDLVMQSYPAYDMLVEHIRITPLED